VRLVVRGRSPGQYQLETWSSVDSKPGPTAAGSDIAAEQASQKSAAAESCIVFKETPNHSGASSEDT
jgi:hypothetical protein